MLFVVEPATADDAPAILELIVGNGLPPDGLLDHLETTLVARRDGRVVGCAALELYPDGALLRSVAVERAARGEGVGQHLVRAALDLAQRGAPRSVYLLTTTAEGFFPRFGFRRIARADVAAGVKGSVEFRSACPASAVVMSMDPGADPRPFGLRTSSSAPPAPPAASRG